MITLQNVNKADQAEYNSKCVINMLREQPGARLFVDGEKNFNISIGDSVFVGECDSRPEGLPVYFPTQKLAEEAVRNVGESNVFYTFKWLYWGDEALADTMQCKYSHSL